MEYQIRPQNMLLSEMKVNSALRDRRIFLSDEVDREIIFEVMYFMNRLRDLDRKNGTKENIELIINSYGGSIYDGNSLLSLIEEFKDEGYKIITTVSGVAMSMGFMLMLVASERQVYRYSTLLCHQPSSGSWGTLQQLQDDVDETNRLWKLMKSIIIKNTKITDEQLEEIKKSKTDWIMTPEQALELGVIDKIL
jgi:ATP-dependent Clp protease protease subunit